MIKRILLFLLTINLVNFAQDLSEMKVVDSAEKLEGEIIAKDVRDANGEVCAGLVIESDLKGLSYNSNNGIVKLKRKPGKDFLFLSPTERLVEIYKIGYMPLTLVLSNYGISLESGEVWKLKITNKSDENLVQVIIVSSPSDASLIFDNEVKLTNSTIRTPPGEHTIILQKDGYKIYKDTISVYDEKNTLAVELEVSSKEGDARSEDYLMKELQKSLNLGIIKGRVTNAKTGEGINRVSITLKSVTQSIIGGNIKLPDKNSEVSLKSDKKGDKIVLNTDAHGNFNTDYLKAGEYRLFIEKYGFYADTLNIDLNPLNTKTLNIELIEDLKSTLIFIKSGDYNTDSTSIKIDDFLIGRYEVTVKEYREYCDETGASMPRNPSWGWNDNDPIVNVNFEEAQKYAKWAGKRLPTKWEWEFAAKGGIDGLGYKYSGSGNINAVAWYNKNSNSHNHPVGSKKHNELGLYDMTGNAMEWCTINYDIPTKEEKVVAKGGSWFSSHTDCLISKDIISNKVDRYFQVGFRLASDYK